MQGFDSIERVIYQFDIRVSFEVFCVAFFLVGETCIGGDFGGVLLPIPQGDIDF